MKKTDFKYLKEFRYSKDYKETVKNHIEELQFAGETCGDALSEQKLIFSSGSGYGASMPKMEFSDKVSSKYQLCRGFLKKRKGWSIVFAILSDARQTTVSSLNFNPGYGDKHCSLIMLERKNASTVSSVHHSFQTFSCDEGFISADMAMLLKTQVLDKNIVDKFYRTQHDFLLLMCCKYYGIEYLFETHKFPEEVVSLKHLTPDFFNLDHHTKTMLIGDVQCSNDTTTSYIRKTEKYKIWSDNFLKKGYTIYECYICVGHNLEGLSRALMNVNLVPVNPNTNFISEWNKVQTIKNHLLSISEVDFLRISKEAFELVDDDDILIDGIDMKTYDDSIQPDEMLIDAQLEIIKNVVESGIINDNKFKTEDIDSASKEISHLNANFVKKVKPTFYIPTIEWEPMTEDNEQLQSYRFLLEASKSGDPFVESMLQNLEHVLKTPSQKNYYMKGKFIDSDEIYIKAKTEYHELRSKWIEENNRRSIKKQALLPGKKFRTFCVEKGYAEPTDRKKAFF
jgi:hypothetical protein